MSVLSLSVLGQPEVRRGGQVIKFRTRKELALLIYLTVEGGMHSREKLQALLWPERDTAHGRMLIRRTLAFLRQALNDTDKHSLIIERDLLGIAPASIELDLHLLDTAFSSVRTSLHAETLQGEARHHVLSYLLSTLACFHGPFLEGFSLTGAAAFENWISIQRATVQRRLDLIFDHLSTLQMEDGKTEDAIETTNRWIVCEPLHEIAVQRLMQLYLAAGYREMALQTYETFRTRLALELQVEPLPEIRALADQIRRETPPRFVPTTKQFSQNTSDWLKSPLIGRTQQYAQLVEAYYATRQGQVRVVLVEGEAGIGKTRLVTDFLNWVSGQDADVLRGQVFETGGRPPYQPLVDALRSRLEQENAPEDLLTDIWLAELSRLLPELRDRYPDLPQPLADKVTTKTRLHEAVVRLGQALSRRSPFVLWLDDVQWADAASLDLLHTLGQRFLESGCAALLIVCMRSEGLIAVPALGTWVASLERNLPVTRLVLGPLTYKDTVQLVEVVLLSPVQRETRNAVPSPHHPSSLSKQFSHWLFNETQGQPLYISETFKALLERKVLTFTVDADGQRVIDMPATVQQTMALSNFLPAGVRNVIRARLMQLTPAALTLLTAGAVLGHGFSFELLYQIAGMGEDEALQALDEVLLHNLLHERAEGGSATGSTYFLSHDKIRDVIYTEAGDARRRILHRRTFDLFHQSSTVAPAVLAYHALAAGLIIDGFQCLVAAGDEAMQLFAMRDAIVVYEQAWQVMKDRVGPSQRNEVRVHSGLQHLYEQLGRAYELTNDATRAQIVYRELLAYACEVQMPEMEVAALNHLATLAAQDSSQRDGARRLLQEAQKRAEESDDRIGLAKTEWNLAQFSYYAFDMQAALHHGTNALRLAEGLQLPELQAQCLNMLAYSNRSLLLWSEAARDAEQARYLYATLRNRAMEADCLGVLADLQISDGLLLTGIETAREAYTISHQIENPWGMVNNALHLTRGLMEMGAYEEALEIAGQSLTLARTLPFHLLLLLTLMTVGAIYRALFQISQARQAHQEALEIDKALPSQRYTAACFAELCADEAVAGEWEEAHRYAKQALAVRDPHVLIWVASPRWLETEALVRAGDVKEAQDDVQRFGMQAESSRRCRITFLRACAVLEHMNGNKDQASLSLHEAVQLTKEIGLPGEQWHILTTLGKTYEQINKPEQAHEAYTQAAATLTTLAHRIQDETLRQDFLAVSQVQSVLQWYSE